jgi:hypothetical protein
MLRPYFVENKCVPHLNNSHTPEDQQPPPPQEAAPHSLRTSGLECFGLYIRSCPIIDANSLSQCVANIYYFVMEHMNPLSEHLFSFCRHTVDIETSLQVCFWMLYFAPVKSSSNYLPQLS